MDRPAFAHGDWLQVYLEKTSRGVFARVVESGGRPGVAVLALRDGEVALVEVHRPAIGRTASGIPRGFGETDVPRADAVRELCEETGIVVAPADLVELGTLHPNDGLLAGEPHLFAVEVDSAAVAQPQDDGEVQRVRWVPVADLLDDVAAGRITDAFTATALLRALLRGVLPGYAVGSSA